MFRAWATLKHALKLGGGEHRFQEPFVARYIAQSPRVSLKNHLGRCHGSVDERIGTVAVPASALPVPFGVPDQFKFYFGFTSSRGFS